MTFQDACDFFCRHGNVGKTKALMAKQPTETQLLLACDQAVLSRANLATVNEAAQAIRDHWGMADPSVVVEPRTDPFPQRQDPMP